MTPIEAAVKRAWAKGFGPGLSDPPFGEDDAKDIINAFLDAAELDMRTSGAAMLAIENGQHASHLGQARAVISALKEAL